MKTQLLLAGLALSFTAAARAADPVTPAAACCVPATPKLACCAEEKPTTPLAARSLYQLDAKWTNDSAATLQLASLRGQPVVLAMFFASCGYACPVLVSDMQRLRNSLPAEVRAKARFVIVSFDAARDTPAALKAFREHASLDDAWTLLRGDESAVQELAMLLGVKFKRDANGQFSHSNLITVLNGEGEISHQHAGLMGDMSDAAKAVVAAK